MHRRASEGGRLQELEDVLQHDVIGLDRIDGLLEGFHANGLQVDRDFFHLRSDAFHCHLELVKAGCGIGLLQDDMARAAGLESVLPNAPVPPLEFWLTAHVELRTSPRIRRVYDFLADRISQRYGTAGSSI